MYHLFASHSMCFNVALCTTMNSVHQNGSFHHLHYLSSYMLWISSSWKWKRALFLSHECHGFHCHTAHEFHSGYCHWGKLDWSPVNLRKFRGLLDWFQIAVKFNWSAKQAKTLSRGIQCLSDNYRGIPWSFTGGGLPSPTMTRTPALVTSSMVKYT